MELRNLDAKTREYMLKELEKDVAEGRLYLSRRLTQQGQMDYESLLREAIRLHDATWLAEQLGTAGRMGAAELSHSKKGNTFVKRTPFNDNETLAYGEFNRYYIRGLCQRAIEDGVEYVVVYRALEVAEARIESAINIGSHVNPSELLEDLRENIGRNTRLGIPGGPNSGISVQLP